MPLRTRLLAEFLGTLLLLATVVGSGIMGVQLSAGNAGIALLANAGATAGMLYVLIVVLGPVSGAHMNPAVLLVFRLRGEHPPGGHAGLRRRAARGCVLAVGIARSLAVPQRAD